MFFRRLYSAGQPAFFCFRFVLFRCEKILVHDKRSPAFHPRQFFEGNSVAYGIFEDRFGNLRRQSVLIRLASPGTG